MTSAECKAKPGQARLARATVILGMAAAILWLAGCGNASPHISAAQTPAAAVNPTSPATPPAPTPTPPAPGNPSPTPPPAGTIFSTLEDMPGWGFCNSADCAGGSGTGTSWMAQNQSSPSLDGSSMIIDNSGIWANALYWLKLGSQDQATNFLWDFEFQVDTASVTAAQALEFDSFQAVDGYNYMMGTQCDYGNGFWDLWDESNSAWHATTIPCPKFAPGSWHHIQLYTQRLSGSPQYQFITLVVDGNSYALGQTYSAKNVGWNDVLGVQYQLDVNATGAEYQEWIDQSTLSIW